MLIFFSKAAHLFAYAQASFNIISQLPRFILEAIAFGGVLLIILYMINKTGNFINYFAHIKFVCFCWISFNAIITANLYIILPAYIYWSILDKVYNDLKNLKYNDQNKVDEIVTLINQFH